MEALLTPNLEQYLRRPVAPESGAIIILLRWMDPFLRHRTGRPTAVDRRSTVRRRASARGRKVGPLSLLKKSTGSVVAVVGRARGEGGRASNPYRERSEWRDLLLTYLTVSRLTFRVFLMIGSRVHRSAFVRQVQLNRAQRYQKCTKLISGTEHRPFYILKRKSATQPIHKLNI